MASRQTWAFSSSGTVRWADRAKQRLGLRQCALSLSGYFEVSSEQADAPLEIWLLQQQCCQSRIEITGTSGHQTDLCALTQKPLSAGQANPFATASDEHVLPGEF
jgi:hypothetical protein